MDEAKLLVFKRWTEFHRRALGFTSGWESTDADCGGDSPAGNHLPARRSVRRKPQKFELATYVAKFEIDLLAPPIRGIANESGFLDQQFLTLDQGRRSHRIRWRHKRSTAR